MKLVEGTVYTKDMKKLASALEAMGLVVNEVFYDTRKVVTSGITRGKALLYNLCNRVKIRTVVNDEFVGPLIETLRNFGECEFSICNQEQACCA